MIPTHPNYPKRFINEVTFIKDGLWFYLDKYRSATDKQRRMWTNEYLDKKPFYTDPSVKKNEGIWADYEDVSEEETDIYLEATIKEMEEIFTENLYVREHFIQLFRVKNYI